MIGSGRGARFVLLGSEPRRLNSAGSEAVFQLLGLDLLTLLLVMLEHVSILGVHVF